MTPYEKSLHIYGPDDKPVCRISSQLWDEVQFYGRKGVPFVRVQEPLTFDMNVTRGVLTQKAETILTLDINEWAHPRHSSAFVACFKTAADGETFKKWYPNLVEAPRMRSFDDPPRLRRSYNPNRID